MSSLYSAHVQKGLLLNANENSNGVDPVILDEMLQAIARAPLNRYPDDSAWPLRQAWARLFHLDPAGVLVGNGSDATLQMMITTFCREGKTLCTLSPDFGMYDFYAGAKEGDVWAFETGWDGSFDLDAFIAFIQAHNAGLVLFSNPNNPTGHAVRKEEIVRLAKAIAPTILAVDEAYMDFSDQSVLHLAQSMDNLIVTRTLSKAWGLAGIRIGFLITTPQLANRIEAWKIVYSVSTLDQCAALAALAHPEVHEDYVRLVRREARRIEKALGIWPELRCGPFEANFYSIALEDPEKNRQLEAALEAAGIAVRTWPDSRRIRITIGLPEENNRVLEQIEAAWRKQNEHDQKEQKAGKEKNG